VDLVIDTSSALAAVAVLEDSRVLREELREAGRGLDLPRWVRSLVDPLAVARLMVALGPGSFTGLRSGAAYALGLALGRRIPLLGYGNLELQQARAAGEPVTGVAEAGRGRVYFRTPGGEEGIAEAAAIPGQGSAVGWLSAPTASLLRLPLVTEDRLGSFGEAALAISGRAVELGYDRVRLRYVHSLGAVD
jgi:tRNA threonylcarbamoyl adenosine modification protein YeaZ